MRLIPFFLGCLVIGTSAGAATIVTGDGLNVLFSDHDGSITAVVSGHEPVPLIVGEPGGIALRVGQRLPGAPVCLLGFDADGGAWTGARNADWDDAGPYATWVITGGTGGSGHLLLGDGVTVGAGMAMDAPVAVPGGSTVRISWQARSASTETTQILCVRLFDASGSDITSAVTAPGGWGWTSTSQAHAVWGLHCVAADSWEHFDQTYTVPQEAASIQVSLRHWTGGDHLVHLDDLAIDVVGGVQWSERIPARGPVSVIPNGIRQAVDIDEYDLRLIAEVVGQADRISIEVQMQDLSGGAEDRPIQLHWALPIAAEGWDWWDDLDTARAIDPGTVFANTFHLAGHSLSLYPFGSITSADVGLALGVPMDETVAQRFEFDSAHGLQSVWEIGLSPLTIKLSPGQAAVSLALFHHDATWGFRAAARKYHEVFPEHFIKRTTREGAWMYPVPPSAIPDPNDFGFAYFETRPLDEAERDVCARHNIGIYHYVEPWIAWQSWGATPDKPPYKERVAVLEDWAAESARFAAWLSDGGVGDTGHLLLGDGTTTGAGMATVEPFAVGGGDLLRIDWRALVTSIETTQILCVRLFDGDGSDITPTVSAPAGWFWSSASQAHVVAGIANSVPEVWEAFSYLYALPAEVSAVRISLRHWNGGDHLVHLDELEVAGIDSAETYLWLPFDVDDTTWLSAYNADWDDAGATWLRAPRQEAAQAVLNSSPMDEDGRYLIDFHPYFWHEWAPGTWYQAWPVNPDPDQSAPNAFALYREKWILDRLDEADGVYIDSVTAAGGVGGWESRRDDHLALSDSPLTFAWLDGGAAQLAPQAHAEFLEPIAAEVRGQGRLMMVNLFPEAMRFHAQDADVLGSEVFRLVEADGLSRLRRTLAGRRIVSNLLQWGWDSPEYATGAQMEEFIRGQLFWGFYPAVSSAGGLLSGGTPDRYFQHPELYERDRPLFRFYMPVIRELSRAGWEPVTYATATPAAQVERFGDFARGPVLLTVRGVAGAALQGDVTVDLEACGLGDDSVLAAAYDVLVDQPLFIEVLPDPARVRFAVSLEAGEVGVYRLRAGRFGDLDEDGDLDGDDFAGFVSCLQGPSRVYAWGDPCRSADADFDGDVDQADFREFQRRFHER